MIFESQSVNVRYCAGYSEPTSSWTTAKNLRWVRTLSRPAVAICITASTSAVARSFITRDSHKVCVEGRWKKFLSLVSHVASASG